MEPYLISTVSTHKGKEEDFLRLMLRVTEAATRLGGAGDGFILRDREDPGLFIVVRRWQSEDALQRWLGSAESRSLWTEAEGIIDSFDGMTGYRVADIAPS